MSMVESLPHRPAFLAKRLTTLYIAALGMIAILTVIGQIVVQQAIVRLEGDSRIVNIAGRQRMLSQRLTRLTLELAYLSKQSRSHPLPHTALFVSATDAASTIQFDLDTWTNHHQGLLRGSEALKLPGKNSKTVSLLFEELAPNFEALKNIVESTLAHFVLSEDAILDDVARNKLSFHSDAFLNGMDDIVARFEQEARDRVSRLRWIECLLLVATIAVLVCEGLFIFSPAVASLSRSLTQLQRISDELEQAKLIAEKANMAKTDFLARVSHELRTPLHAILGMMGLVQQGKLPQDQRKKIRLADEASTSLLSLVDNLLDVASIEQGKEIILHPAEVNLLGLLTSTAEVMRPMAIQKGLQFKLTMDDAMPKSVMIDADRVRQILTNLLQNAIRYTTNGYVRCRADILAETKQLFLRIAVEDTGIGISKDNHERVFSSFDRGDHTEASSTFGRGMGLGLAITQAMVTKLNGTISLTSQVGAGSRFVVIIPIQPVLESTRLSEPVLNRPNSTSSVFHTDNAFKPTALIVDDEPTNLLVMRSYLKHLGYKTMSVKSLAESLVKFQKYHFDLIFMDRHLTDGDGLNFPKLFLQNITSETDPDRMLRVSATKVFLVTAEVHLQPNGDRRLDPFAGVLHKPISIGQLKEAIISANRRELACSEEKTENSEARFDFLRRKLSLTLFESLPNEIASIKEKIAHRNYAGIEFVAHRLIGSAGNAGMIDVAELCKELHKAALDEDQKCIEDILSKLADRLVAA